MAVQTALKLLRVFAAQTLPLRLDTAAPTVFYTNVDKKYYLLLLLLLIATIRNYMLYVAEKLHFYSF